MQQLIFILFILIGLDLYSQKSEVTIYELNGKTAKEYSTSILQTKKIAEKHWLNLVENGFLSASIDSLILSDSLHHKIYIYKGNKFIVDKVISNIPPAIQSQIGFKESFLKNKGFSSNRLIKTIENTLAYCNNNGYPFALFQLNQSEIDSSTIFLNLDLNLGPLITVDSIILNPEILDQKRVIQQIINIKKGDAFNQNLINSISTRIKETPYLTELSNPEYEFINNKISLFINAKNKPANFINGILGVQPQNDGSINITGDANIKFINGIKKGETISVKWKKMYALSQSLSSVIEFPYLLNSSFGIFNNLDMLKKDSTFFNLKNKIGSTYSFTEKTKLGMYYLFSRSNMLSSINSLNFNSTSLNSFGIIYKYDRLDYKYNPRKGFFTKGDLQFGFKNLLSQSDTLIENSGSSNYQFDLTIESYLPLGKKSTLKLGCNFASIINPILYENELHRIGGNNLLRGFDEESIWTSSYLIGTIEYRLILEQNSNLFAFFDIGWVEKKLTHEYLNDIPYGLGAGINFETKPGIFSISYALGSQQNNPLLFKTAKIHFGFINFF